MLLWLIPKMLTQGRHRGGPGQSSSQRPQCCFASEHLSFANTSLWEFRLNSGLGPGSGSFLRAPWPRRRTSALTQVPPASDETMEQATACRPQAGNRHEKTNLLLIITVHRAVRALSPTALLENPPLGLWGLQGDPIPESRASRKGF